MKRILFAIALFVGGLNSLWAGQIPMQIIDHRPAAGGSTLAPPALGTSLRINTFRN